MHIVARLCTAGTCIDIIKHIVDARWSQDSTKEVDINLEVHLHFLGQAPSGDPRVHRGEVQSPVQLAGQPDAAAWAREGFWVEVEFCRPGQAVFGCEVCAHRAAEFWEEL